MMTDEETLIGVVFLVILLGIVINFFSVNMLMEVFILNMLTFPFPSQSALKYLRRIKDEQNTASLENRGTLFTHDKSSSHFDIF